MTLWREVSPGLYMQARVRGPTILYGFTDGRQNTPGGAVQNAWLVGLLNRHISNPADRVPLTARTAFVYGMFLGASTGAMVRIDFGDPSQPLPPAHEWPGEQGDLYATTGAEMRMPFGMIPVPVFDYHGSPAFWFRWGVHGNQNQVLGYHLWLGGYA